MSIAPALNQPSTFRRRCSRRRKAITCPYEGKLRHLPELTARNGWPVEGIAPTTPRAREDAQFPGSLQLCAVDTGTFRDFRNGKGDLPNSWPPTLSDFPCRRLQTDDSANVKQAVRTKAGSCDQAEHFPCDAWRRERCLAEMDGHSAIRNWRDGSRGIRAC